MFLKLLEFVKVHFVSGMCHCEGPNTGSYHFSSSSSTLFIPVVSLCPSCVTPLASRVAFHCNDIPSVARESGGNNCASHSSDTLNTIDSKQSDMKKLKVAQSRGVLWRIPNVCFSITCMCQLLNFLVTEGGRQWEKENGREQSLENAELESWNPKTFGSIPPFQSNGCVPACVWMASHAVTQMKLCKHCVLHFFLRSWWIDTH